MPRLEPPSTSRPMPVARRRSISAQSGGAEHVISVAVSFSTQRKAGMSSLDPSRIPAWLAPVCEDRSVSHSVRRCVSSASQRAMVGALPSRIARRSTGSASPSISRKTIPGTSVLGDDALPTRDPLRDAERVRVVRAERGPRARRSPRRRRARRAAPSRSCRRVSTPSVRSSVSSRMAGVGDQDEQEAEHERERQPQRGEHGRDDRVQRRDDRRDEQRAPEVVDADAGQEPGGHHQRDARGEPRDERARTP